MRATSPRNSTNVRKSIALFVASWGICVAGGASAGIFASLSSEEVIGVAAFATIFATASYFLDAEIRAWFAALDGRVARRAAGMAAALAFAGLIGVLGDTMRIGAFAGSAWLLFVVPLALALQAALVDRALRSRAVNSPRGKVPGVRRAAT